MIVYEPKQIENIYPFIDFEPGWFILGGPADACEAQEMRKKYPNICIIGFEPHPELYNVQLARGFPGRLLPVALWEDSRELILRTVVDQPKGPWQDRRASSVNKFTSSVGREVCRVKATTLDTLSSEYGPFEDAILWIDIEEAELYALRGAAGLMATRQIRLINAEVDDQHLRPIAELLAQFGIREVHRWNANTRIIQNKPRYDWWNIIYKLKE